MRPDILTVREVADWLHVCQEHIRRLARARKIPCFKVGRWWRFWEYQVREWIAAGQPSQQEQPGLFEGGGETDGR